jgi:hypothetical protein
MQASATKHMGMVPMAEIIEQVMGYRTEVDGNAEQITIYGATGLTAIGRLNKLAQPYGWRVRQSATEVIMEAK